MQKVLLIGHLGRDPEVKYSQQGTAIAQFSVATTERWKDKGGELQEHTEWFAVKSLRSEGRDRRRESAQRLTLSSTSMGSSSWTPRSAGTDIESQPKAALTKQL